MRMIISGKEVAIEAWQSFENLIYKFDFLETYTCKHGLFVPIGNESSLFMLRALRGEFEGIEEVENYFVNEDYVHIDRMGMVWVVNLLKNKNITRLQVPTNAYIANGFTGNVRAQAIAYSHLLDGVKTMPAAIKRMEKICPTGLNEYTILNAQEVGKHLTEKKCMAFMANNLRQLLA